jgi:hypothetical protein
MTPETNISREIQLALGSRPDIRVFRNSVGVATTRDGSVIRFGLAPGSSDLIGWRTITVTPDMVGKRIAVFTGVEVKTPTGAIRKNQLLWQSALRSHGGISEILRSPSEINRVINWTPS